MSKSNFYQKVKLKNIIITLVTGTILLGVGISAYLSFSKVYKNKLTDTWTILYLDLEQKLFATSSALQKFTHFSVNQNNLIFNQQPEAMARLDKTTNSLERIEGILVQSGTVPGDLTSRLNKHGSINIVSLGGLNYIMKSVPLSMAKVYGKRELDEGSYFFLWPFKARDWIHFSSFDKSKVVIYGVNTSGQILFKNRDSISQENVASRPLVQRFVTDNLNKGQSEFTNNSQGWFGFYGMVPETNLVFFQEMEKSFAFQEIKGDLVNFSLIIFGMMMACLIFLYVALDRVILPIRSIIGRLTNPNPRILGGKALVAGIGEFNLLNQAFDHYLQDANVTKRIMQDQVGQAKAWTSWPSPMGLILPTIPIPSISNIEAAIKVLGHKDHERFFYDYLVFPKRKINLIILSEISISGPSAFMLQTAIKTYFSQIDVDGDCKKNIKDWISAIPDALTGWGIHDPQIKILILCYSDGEGGKILDMFSSGSRNLLLLEPNGKSETFLADTGIRPISLENSAPSNSLTISVKDRLIGLYFSHSGLWNFVKEQDHIVKDLGDLLKGYSFGTVEELLTLVRGYLNEALTGETLELAHLVAIFEFKMDGQ
jgi:hypothetical protein